MTRLQAQAAYLSMPMPSPSSSETEDCGDSVKRQGRADTAYSWVLRSAISAGGFLRGDGDTSENRGISRRKRISG